MSLEKAKLDNGLTLYVDRIPGSNTNNASMFIPYGSVDEEPGHEGVAHVFEHCVHLETDQFADRQDLRQYAKLNGMVTNANTYFTRTLYYANGLELEPNMNHLSQILQHTHLPEESVEHEMKAVRREMSTTLDNVGGLHSLASIEAMFGKPYGRSVGGYHDKLDFEAETLQQLHQRYYKLGNMALIVSGKANIDEVAELAGRYFTADDEPVGEINHDLPVTLGEHHTTGLVRDDSRNVRMSVAYPMSADFRERFNQRRLAFGVATKAMSDASFQALRYDKGISYDGSVSTSVFNHPNAWDIRGSVTTDQESIDTAIDTFGDIFERDSSRYSNEDILGTLAMYKYYFSQYLTSPDDRVDSHVNRLQSYREPQDIRATMRQLKKTTVADVRDAIDEIAELTAQTPKYTHLTGQRQAIGEVDRIIEQDEIA